MRYVTFGDDKAGRLQLELMWDLLRDHQAPRRNDEQRDFGRLLDKVEAITDEVPAQVTCPGCARALFALPVDMPEQRTITEGSGPRRLDLEESEYRLALAVTNPEKLNLPGRRVRTNLRLRELLEKAPESASTTAT